MTSPTRGADPTAPLVLVADDEPDVLGSVVPFMERAGFRVISANDGKLALDEIRRHGPDACVLDVLMPGADGREVLRTLRREENWVPVVLLTQVGEAVERAMALEEGADDYLNKPFDPHELVARVRAVLRRTRNDGPPLATASVSPRRSAWPSTGWGDGPGWVSASSSSLPRASRCWSTS